MNFIKLNWRKAGCASVMEALFEHNSKHYPEQFLNITPKLLAANLTELVYGLNDSVFKSKTPYSKFALALYCFAFLSPKMEDTFTMLFYRDMYRVLRDEETINYTDHDYSLISKSSKVIYSGE